MEEFLDGVDGFGGWDGAGVVDGAVAEATDVVTFGVEGVAKEPF